MNGSAKMLKRPSNVVRPASFAFDEDDDGGSAKKRKKLDPLKDANVMVRVFRYLDIATLNRCLQVCKDWNRIVMSPVLWKRTDLSHQ